MYRKRIIIGENIEEYRQFIRINRVERRITVRTIDACTVSYTLITVHPSRSPFPLVHFPSCCLPRSFVQRRSPLSLERATGGENRESLFVCTSLPNSDPLRHVLSSRAFFLLHRGKSLGDTMPFQPSKPCSAPSSGFLWEYWRTSFDGERSRVR